MANYNMGATGLRIDGVPIQGNNIPVTFGDYYYVYHSTGVDSAGGGRGKSMSEPFATIAYAYSQCTASQGDVIIVHPYHAETILSEITMSTIGVTAWGLCGCVGNDKPTVTVNGAIDGFAMDAANNTIANIHFGSPGTDAQTSFIDVNAANCKIFNISGIGSETGNNVVDCITVTANADDLLIDGVEFFNSVVAVNSFLSLEGAAARVVVKNFFAFGDVATAGIIDAAKVDYLVLENVNVGVVGTTKPAATLDSNPEGYARNCNFAGTHGTLATNANHGNLMRCFEVRVLEETDNSAQGALIPAVDAD